ncbi:extracellular solute-binding protein [Anaeromicropila populeti]|uniref:Putative aldouronate transport system substrate-binding protein n=1 Tax=Anaeromicropila populeti TaxID=37658 RepID=A0A1I6J9D2_9FIRM|nr:extracellular solute-binding protein [Anaeromicropila populeti]SFR75544.1 putative aldouronate transport system substrate-binding protein [Anaeromicropila populeti]
MKKFKRLTALVLALTLAMASLSGCGKAKEDDKATTSEAVEATETADGEELTGADKYPEFLTVDVFSNQSNFQGIQAGWFGKIVKEKFNMELNIIAPNVAGGGDTLYQTRSAAGNLGDIVFMGSENGRLSDMIEANLLLDITDYVANSEYIKTYTQGIEWMKSVGGTDKIYAIPSLVSTQSATTPSEGLDLTYGPYIRWDYYTELGTPEIKTFEDLLPILKQMQDAHPTSDSGKPTYAISLFKDWDGNMMNNAKQPTCLYGYDEMGFVLSKADGTDYQSIIDSDSQYVRVLKFFFDANQMGLVDPESTTQDYSIMYTKYQDGAVLYSPWPWLGQSAYNTVDNKAAGKGFMVAPVQDMTILSNGCSPQGDKYVASVGAKAKDPQRMVDFLDWLYSPEGIMTNCAPIDGTCGPEGMTWEMVDGRPELTELGKELLLNGDGAVPDEFGGGSWKEGSSWIAFNAVLQSDINPNTGFSYKYNLWDSVLELKETPLDTSWKEKMGAKSTLEYLQNNNQILIAPGCDFLSPAEDAQISTLRSQCKAIIVENSWKMIFADSEDEFNSLLATMQDQVKGLGYDEVLEFDMQNAKDQNAARDAVR